MPATATRPVAGPHVLIMGGLSTAGSINLTVTAPAAGSFALNNVGPVVMLLMTDAATGYSWGGSITVGSGGSPSTAAAGFVVISSLAATRVRGTFSGTLASSPGSAASGSLLVTGGEFDIGLP